MVGWHLWFKGQELGQIPGDGEGQGSRTCCIPWGHEESWTRLGNWMIINNCKCFTYISSFQLDTNIPEVGFIITILIIYRWENRYWEVKQLDQVNPARSIRDDLGLESMLRPRALYCLFPEYPITNQSHTHKEFTEWCKSPCNQSLGLPMARPFICRAETTFPLCRVAASDAQAMAHTRVLGSDNQERVSLMCLASSSFRGCCCFCWWPVLGETQALRDKHCCIFSPLHLHSSSKFVGWHQNAMPCRPCVF